MYKTWSPETSRHEAHGAATRGLRRDTIHVAGCNGSDGDDDHHSHDL